MSHWLNLCGVLWGDAGPTPAQAGRNQAGYALIEVVLAAAILAMGFGAVTVTVSMAIRTAGATSNLMGAMHFAREQMERVTTNAYSAAELDVGTHAVSNDTLQATYVVTSAGANRKNLELRVPYPNPVTGAESVVELRTRLVGALHP